MSFSGNFFGKYRGTVVNNQDPLKRGRLQVLVPDVYDLIPSSWAEACVPLAGPTGPAMGVYLIPPVGAGVWVEFEQGDPDYPIWTGCRWGLPSDIPSSGNTGNPASPNIVVQTLGQNSLIMNDIPGPGEGITLKSSAGAFITVNNDGIYINNGQGAVITLIGPIVDINNKTLEVLG